MAYNGLVPRVGAYYMAKDPDFDAVVLKREPDRSYSIYSVIFRNGCEQLDCIDTSEYVIGRARKKLVAKHAEIFWDNQNGERHLCELDKETLESLRKASGSSEKKE